MHLKVWCFLGWQDGLLFHQIVSQHVITLENLSQEYWGMCICPFWRQVLWFRQGQGCKMGTHSTLPTHMHKQVVWNLGVIGGQRGWYSPGLCPLPLSLHQAPPINTPGHKHAICDSTFHDELVLEICSGLPHCLTIHVCKHSFQEISPSVIPQVSAPFCLRQSSLSGTHQMG